ncbi:MAG: hypothetical protein IJA50_02430 [Firmicutes bacterium]|nr:hypothetical protein [Bacillota bacterium]
MTTIQKKENIAEKLLRKAIAFVVVMALTIPLIAPGVFAASSVYINCSDSVKGGETFTVAVVFSGGDVGRVDAQMTYNTDELTYISGGTSKGDTGFIQLKSAGTEGAIVFNIKFQALTDGDADVEVTTNEMYDLDERAMGTPSAYKTIAIQGDASSDQVITEPPDEEQPEEPSSLTGVDEKTEEAEEEFVVSDTMIMIASAVLALIIIVICILLGRRKNKKKRKTQQRRYRSDRYNDEYDDIENW